MNCRKCGQELAEDTPLCHHCGTVQRSYISEPEWQPPQKKRMDRNTKITYMALGLIFVLALCLLPVIRGSEEGARLESVRRVVAALDSGDELSVLAAKQSVESFVKSYPHSKGVAEVNELLTRAVGSSGPEQTDTQRREAVERRARAQTQARDAMKPTIQRDIFSLKELSFDFFPANDSITVTARWRNKSNKGIDQLYLCVAAYDTKGHVIPSRNTGKSETTLVSQKQYEPTAKDELNENVYQDVWYTADMGRLELTRVFIVYRDGSTVSLDGDLLPLIWETN